MITGPFSTTAVHEGPTDELRPVLDYILDSVVGDERPYLRLSIYGKEFLGLLDSGASRTIINGQCWSVLKKLGVTLESHHRVACTVANGQVCSSIGSCRVPMKVKDKVVLMEVLIMLELPRMILLGADFWRALGIVPNLRNNEWFFSAETVHVATVDTHLDENQETKLNELVDKTFGLMGDDVIGCTNLVEHEILVDGPPVKQRYYPVSPVLQKHIDQQLNDMLQQGIVEKSSSPWSSPIIMVKKKDGTYRFCVDYRKVNAVTKKDSYPLPYVSNTLDKLRNAKYISSLDIKSAFWQVPVKEESRQYTAFTVPNRGLFQFRRMPFGLSNSPATWQRLMDVILGSDLEPCVFFYLDDVIIVTENFEKHLEILEEVFRRLHEAGLTVSRDKCQFCRSEMRYLGYVVNSNGLQVDPEKVKAMVEIAIPRNVKHVRSIVGTFSWYRRFIPNFSDLISPLTNLLKKNSKFLWTPECEQSFTLLKEKLVSAPIMSCPNYDLPFQVQTDASGYGLGAVLSQPDPKGGEKVICYISRSLTRQEQNFSTTERECLAVLWALEKLRPYIEGIKVEVITDHYCLVWLQNIKAVSGRLARWIVRLQQFEFSVTHRKGSEHHVPDLLSRSVPKLDLITVDDFNNIVDPWYLRMLGNVKNRPGKFPTWRIQDGFLYKYLGSSVNDLGENSWKLVVPKQLRMRVIQDMHDSCTSGHMGVFKTHSRLCERYFWPKSRSDVARYVGNCRICLRHKVDSRKPAGLMASHYPDATKPWEVVSSDLIGPLPRSKRGNSYIFVVNDYFSKFCLTFPMRRATSAAVCKALEEGVFLIFGVPRVIISDNGPQYKNEYLKLLEKYKIRPKFNANFHAQANPTERYNRTLKFLLSAYASDNHQRWDENLAELTCAMRTSRNETTKYTPYFVNFGRRMMLSGDDYNITLQEDPALNSTEETRSKGFQKIFSELKARLKSAAGKNAHYYNLRRRNEEFMVHQPVYRRNFVLSDASKHFTKKLAPKWIGPFIVAKKLSPWTYRLHDNVGNDKGVWHVKDLKSDPTEKDD